LENTATLTKDTSTTPIMRRMLSGVDKNAIAAKLAEAGWYGTSVTTFVLSRFVCFGVLAGLGVLVLLALHRLSLPFMLVAALIAAIGFALPSFVLDDAIRKRKIAIGNRLPDLLDMVSTSVEAGIALNQALATATSSMTGPLADEIEMMLSDIRLGRNRADAFNAMSQRVRQVDLSSFVMTMVQTDRLGGNVGGVLDELAEEARARRMQRAEEIAASLPVKMVIPMAFLMLPALFIMIFTPVIAMLVHR
jgi:tight adherence protein C